VKIVSDQLLSVGDAKIMSSWLLAHENLKFKFYNPTYNELETSDMEIAQAGLTNLSGINQRMHSKLLLVDEKVGIIGGRNHENMYFDRDPKYNFKDRDILVIGPVVADMLRSFHEYWNYKFSVPGQYLNDVGAHLEAGDYELFQVDESLDEFFPDIHRNASDYEHIRRVFVEKAFRVEGEVEFFADAPGKPEDADKGATWSTSAGIRSVVLQAADSLVIQTPYLMFSSSALRSLRKFRRMHPDLEIIAITNSLASTDHFFTYAVAMKQKKKMLKNLRFKIFELKPVPGDVHKMIPRYDQLVEEAKALREKEEMEKSEEAGDKREQEDTRMLVKAEGPITGLHAKSLVIDDRIALVGSHNFDPRSAIYDTQLAVAIWDEQVARALKANILRDTEHQNSWVVAKQQQVPLISFFSGIIETISRALPILDIWPFKYSSSFELKEGQEPVPPDDPEFYESYENVGQFPEVESSAKDVQTRLFSTMGGFAEPLM
jgi:phosphatidylserine/phosphatidylglycerophosphate/cardiolipin synthase-like enzyme